MKNPGIYILTNKINGKQYVGRDSNLPRRANRHLRGENTGCCLIQKAIKKYGRDTFDAKIIPYPCITNEALNAVEIWKIIELNTKAPHGYNLTDGGKGLVGYSHKPEIRQKMSEAHRGKKLSPETRRKISDGNRGKTLSLEARQKLSEYHRGKTLSPRTRQILLEYSRGRRGENHPMYGKTHTPETRQRLSEINRGKTHTPETRRKISDGNRGKNSIEKKKIHHIQYLYKNGIRPLYVIASIVDVSINTVYKYIKDLR